ncbi:C-terminal domain of adenylylcyclase associated protein, partial [Caulochytrium protostelioides]
PPVFRLEGNKWLIEHQVNNNDIVVENAEINQTVYIFGCQNSTVQVRGKVNAVILDGSRKVGLVVENVLSTVETINCKSCQIQITGITPTV